MAEFKTWRAYQIFEHAVRRHNRYLHDPEVMQFLSAVALTAEKRRLNISKGQPLWRARPGHEWEQKQHADCEYPIEVPCPFEANELMPLVDKAVEGRVNPKGISCLYLATTERAAISEVRPWTGPLVSVGILKTEYELSVIDCSKQHEGVSFYMEEPCPEEREIAVWKDIDRAFAEPVLRTDDVAEYVPTQILAELFRSIGAHGVAYKSAFGEDGYNVALFNTTAAQVSSCHLFKVTGVELSYRNEDNSYFGKPLKDGGA